MVHCTGSCAGIEPRRLRGFFVGWPHPPSPETHLQLLAQSDHVVLAFDETTDDVIGFITALTDGILSAYIPLLEVLPAYQGRGIGQTLVRRMLERLGDLYMIDLLCDPELESFYDGLGMRPAFGIAIRSYNRQSGATA